MAKRRVDNLLLHNFPENGVKFLLHNPVRNERERPELLHQLEISISKQPIRREVRTMGRTIAEALREEGKREGKREGELKGERKGELKGKQSTLILQLRSKFGEQITPTIVARIKKTNDLNTLDEWLGNVLTAGSLREVGVPVKP